MVFGNGTCPASLRGKGMDSECLIKVYAKHDIAAGEELLVSYGPDFWANLQTP